MTARCMDGVPSHVSQADAALLDTGCPNRALWEVVEARRVGPGGDVWPVRTGRLVCGRHRRGQRVAPWPAP